MASPLTRKIRALVGSVRRSALVDRRISAAAKSVLTESLEARMMLSTYYVSTSGSDSNSGTSSTSAWKTIGKANSADLNPGDTLLFQGGQTFNGSLSITSGDSGSASNPVTVGSYGSGRATISAGNGRGIYALNSQYFNIDNLIIVGSGPYQNTTIGIKIDSNLSNATLNNINIDNVDVSGFGAYGIEVVTEKSGGWYNNIRITNSAAHNNMMTGIYTVSQSLYGIKNLYIGQTSAYGNPGDGDWGSGVSGSGININGVDGGVIEYCTAYGNGSNGTGGCGIWSSSSNNLLFQYNDAYSNITRGQRDGDGLDFDQSTSNSIMQYNYAYNNDGSGFMFCNGTGSTLSCNDVIRYNIAENNGQANNYSAFDAWGRIINSSVYGNDFYISTGPDPIGIKIQNGTIENLFVQNLAVYNNIVVATGSQPLVFVSGQELNGATGLSLQGNDYYSLAGTPNFTYGGYFSNLNDWQNATGQEQAGMYANPDLVNIGSGGLVSDANLDSLTGYKLQSGSPLIDAGVSIPPPAGIAQATSDFFGDAAPQGQGYDIGADEFGNQTGAVSTPPVVTPPVQTPPTVTPPSTTALPSGWTSQDIGAVGAAGSSAFANGNYTIVGSGLNINDQADAFHYDSTSQSGDGTIIAQITSLGNANPWSKAGVMIRDGSDPGAPEVSMLVSPNGMVEFEDRAAAGQTTTDVEVSESGARWEKLVRTGNTFTGYVSKDGSTWIQIGSTAVTMDSQVDIGLAVASRVTSTLETAVFSNVSIM